MGVDTSPQMAVSIFMVVLDQVLHLVEWDSTVMGLSPAGVPSMLDSVGCGLAPSSLIFVKKDSNVILHPLKNHNLTRYLPPRFTISDMILKQSIMLPLTSHLSPKHLMLGDRQPRHLTWD